MPRTSPRTAPRTRTRTGARTGGSTEISVFTNIPNPYNDRLYAALRAAGAVVHVVYARAAADEGRPWVLDLHPDERVVRSTGDEARAWQAAAGTHVILSGSYATPTDLARRVATARRARTVHVWGERLRPNNAAVHLLRRGYLAPVRLDGILAVGSRAVPTYLEVVGEGPAAPPVHTFPYTTDRGLDVAPAPGATPIVGYAGRLLAYKGVDVLVRALAAVAATDRPRLEVAGDGPDAAALQALAVALGVEGSIDWLGALTPAELERRRSRWWLQAVPSQRSEGWGVVVHEALCSGVPVIASAHVNAAADLVRDGENGAVIDGAATAEPGAWAAVLSAMLADGRGRAAMARRARVVAAAFSPEHAATFLTQVLERAASADREGRAATARSFVDEGWRRLAGATPDAAGAR